MSDGDDSPDVSPQTFEIRSDEAPSEVVVRAVATLLDSDPTDIEPLYDSVDPEALDQLLASAGDRATSQVAVTFSFDGYRLTVTHDAVEVAALADE